MSDVRVTSSCTRKVPGASNDSPAKVIPQVLLLLYRFISLSLIFLFHALVK
jgi:hypothetical protein